MVRARSVDGCTVAQPEVLGPEAADALSELAVQWRVDPLEAYRLLLWLAIDPAEAGLRADLAAASFEPAPN